VNGTFAEVSEADNEEEDDEEDDEE